MLNYAEFEQIIYLQLKRKSTEHSNKLTKGNATELVLHELNLVLKYFAQK